MELPSHNTSVLFIDPNNDDRQYWVERLKICSQDYLILEARDAKTGLAICQSERVDCVVMELHLPDMSGFQVLIRLNPIVRSLGTPVVALTHFVLPSLADLARRLGAQSYLLKAQSCGDDLDRAIQKAIAAVGPSEKRLNSSRSCSS
jgi:CheY-like chemotaxis protein